ncbi:DUF4232 domain-containing protein [Streptomyces sp. MJP52]|uniref:DUF4232 domain-containing protein n=1 Tax=Streptomyces sp. MJP52 TaxID=2940555 RepID=UPI002473178C|nr:DUF4232 domain-containing protein [Streptomyces sp. MJP52]MDH6228707.1 hypothetical protein [Streptomyces sp. MJP52]
MGPSRAPRRRGVPWPVAAALCVPVLLAGCSQTDDGSSARAGGRATDASPTASASSAASSAPASAAPSGPPASSAAPESRGGSPSRCRTSGLAASVGPGDAGAGQRGFPVALTNRSQRSCTLRGYPGAAFTDASGTQLGPDPRRTRGTPVTTVELSPGESAWATLSFSDPRLTGSEAKVPATLLVTPPDERRPLSVRWEGGEVPVSGNAAVSVTAFGEG